MKSLMYLSGLLVLYLAPSSATYLCQNFKAMPGVNSQNMVGKYYMNAYYSQGKTPLISDCTIMTMSKDSSKPYFNMTLTYITSNGSVNNLYNELTETTPGDFHFFLSNPPAGVPHNVHAFLLGLVPGKYLMMVACDSMGQANIGIYYHQRVNGWSSLDAQTMQNINSAFQANNMTQNTFKPADNQNCGTV